MCFEKTEGRVRACTTSPDLGGCLLSTIPIIFVLCFAFVQRWSTPRCHLKKKLGHRGATHGPCFRDRFSMHESGFRQCSMFLDAIRNMTFDSSPARRTKKNSPAPCVEKATKPTGAGEVRTQRTMRPFSREAQVQFMCNMLVYSSITIETPRTHST